MKDDLQPLDLVPHPHVLGDLRIERCPGAEEDVAVGVGGLVSVVRAGNEPIG